MDEEGVMAADLWTEDGRTMGVTLLTQAEAFRKKGGTIALYD